MIDELACEQKINENLEEKLLNADQYFAALKKDISLATNNITIETYIYREDFFGKEIAEWLIQAAKRGVKIRFLIDGLGLMQWSASLTEMEQAGITIRIYHPMPWRLWQWSRANFRAAFWLQFFYFLYKLNSRNHRKVCMIDSLVYVGSVNITAQHLHKDRGGEGWMDTVVRLKNSNANDLQLAFECAWQEPKSQRLKYLLRDINFHSIFRLNYTRRLRRAYYKSLLRRIVASKKRIWFTISYFNPDYFLLKSLLKAAKRNIDIKIILPQKSDVLIMPYVASTFYREMLKEHIEIYEFLPSILHSKILIIDDWYCVGSSNFNHRSLFHDLEVDVILKTQSAKENLQQQFIDNLQQSRKISTEDLKKISFFRTLFSRLLLFGRYFF